MVADTECGSACYCRHYVGDTEGTSLYHQAPCVPDQQLPYPPFPSLEHSVPATPPPLQTIRCLAFSLFCDLDRKLGQQINPEALEASTPLESLSRAGLGSEGLWAGGMLFRDAFRREAKRPVSLVMRMPMGVGSQLKSPKDCVTLIIGLAMGYPPWVQAGQVYASSAVVGGVFYTGTGQLSNFHPEGAF